MMDLTEAQKRRLVELAANAISRIKTEFGSAAYGYAVEVLSNLVEDSKSTPIGKSFSEGDKPVAINLEFLCKEGLITHDRYVPEHVAAAIRDCNPHP
jgi:hypothetical protein